MIRRRAPAAAIASGTARRLDRGDGEGSRTTRTDRFHGDRREEQQRAGERGSQMTEVDVAFGEVDADPAAESRDARDRDRLAERAARRRVPRAEADEDAGGHESAAEAGAIVRDE